MRALIKSSIILALLAVSVYLYWSQSQDFFAPPKPEALIAPVDPAAKAEEELDYLVAKRIGSLREWPSWSALRARPVRSVRFRHRYASA